MSHKQTTSAIPAQWRLKLNTQQQHEMLLINKNVPSVWKTHLKSFIIINDNTYVKAPVQRIKVLKM